MNTAEQHDNFSQIELDKFNALASRWWDPQGPQKPLHVLNPARLDYIRERIALRGARVLDVGCGAGLLSEALAREGVKTVDMVCPGFAVDCLETLEENAVENAALFKHAGGAELRYIPALNATPGHVAALATLARRHAQGWPH